jgi:predicted RNA-binding Zn-ribbon protein involved in translation (DUF1610 family)
MTEPTDNQRRIQAYDRMLERVKLRLEELERFEKAAFPRLWASIEHAAEKAVELGELTHEEAQLIGSYLHRDLEDAGQYLRSTGRELRDWLRFDLELLEDRLLDFFQRGVDQSRIDLMRFEQPSSEEDDLVEYLSGEIIGPGTLQCAQCGEQVVFLATAAIAPCTACGGTVFLRVEASASLGA